MAGDRVSLEERGAERVTVTDIVVVFIEDALPDIEPVRVFPAVVDTVCEDARVAEIDAVPELDGVAKKDVECDPDCVSDADGEDVGLPEILAEPVTESDDVADIEMAPLRDAEGEKDCPDGEVTLDGEVD